MNLYFFYDTCFVKDQQGRYFDECGLLSYGVFQRYLRVFDKVIIVARTRFKRDFGLSQSNFQSSGPGIQFVELPYYRGLLEFFLVKNEISLIIKKNIRPGFAYICRLPSLIGSIACKLLLKHKLAYGVEVVGDPWEIFSSHNRIHWLAPLLRLLVTFQLRRNVKKANAVQYVTEFTLQKKYPGSRNAFKIAASDVLLRKIASFCDRKVLTKKSEYTILSIGSLAQMYKSPDVVLQAMKLLVKMGIPVRLVWLGDGRNKVLMEKIAQEYGISGKVNFMGLVDQITVTEIIQASDIFVLASRTEGLPRALLEAMSVGLPCIGTNVGGIPELLDAEAVIPKENPGALADKIKFFIENLEFANLQAERNLKRSLEYDPLVLEKKRDSFYKSILEASLF